MKRIILILLTCVTAFTCISCGNTPEEPKEAVFETAQMQRIAELAVMECYYHNVAKYYEKDAEGILLWKKDKRFWIEYSGIVKFGIDASLIDLSVEDNVITITIPEATVQGCKVDSSSLTKDSFIIDKRSAKITSEDEKRAFDEAQEYLKETASNDKMLLMEARNRAKSLLSEYVDTIGDAVGKKYKIKWIFIDAKGDSTGSVVDDIDNEQSE